MFLKKPVSWLTAIIAIIAALELAAIIVIVNYKPSDGFDSKMVKPIDNFAYRNEITCTIVHSTHQAGQPGMVMPWYENHAFTLTGLDADSPSMIVNGKKWTDLKKTSVAEGHILLQKSSGGESDTISLMTNNGSFVRTITGIQAGDWRFHYAIAQKGRCE